MTPSVSVGTLRPVLPPIVSLPLALSRRRYIDIRYCLLSKRAETLFPVVILVPLRHPTRWLRLLYAKTRRFLATWTRLTFPYRVHLDSRHPAPLPPSRSAGNAVSSSIPTPNARSHLNPSSSGVGNPENARLTPLVDESPALKNAEHPHPPSLPTSTPSLPRMYPSKRRSRGWASVSVMSRAMGIAFLELWRISFGEFRRDMWR